MKTEMSISTHTVLGTIEKFIFRNPENGFVIADFLLDNNQRIKIKGTIPNAQPGITYSLSGDVQVDKFGETFVVDNYDVERPVSKEAIKSYLKTLDGCGAITAGRIVDKFGEDALKVCEEEPDKIALLQKVGSTRAERIRHALCDRKEDQSAEVGLREVLRNTPPHVAVKAKLKWDNTAIDMIKEDPYRLTELDQVGFEIADTVARRLGMKLTDPRRLKAGTDYVAKEWRQQGHTVFPMDKFVSDASTKLGLEGTDTIMTWLETTDAKENWRVWPGTNSCQLQKDWAAEMEIGSWLGPRILAAPNPQEHFLVPEPEMKGFAADQADAFTNAAITLQNGGVFIISGPPGTGKTWLVNKLLEYWDNKTCLLIAPTGKAAQRLREMTGRSAKTIHRGLGVTWKSAGPAAGKIAGKAGGFAFTHAADNPLSHSLVIVDEVSMVDLHLFKHLTRAITGSTGLLLVGDHNQLPSVGAGCVLRDLLRAGVPSAVLTTIKRQNPGGIVQTCHAMVSRQPPPFELFNQTDLYMVNCPNVDDIAGQIVDLAHVRLPKWLYPQGKAKDWPSQIQVLSPRRTKHLLGTDVLNEQLRANLIALGKIKLNENHPFSQGDRVIQTKNDYELELFNGDTGTIEGLIKDQKTDRGYFYNISLDAGGEKLVSTKSNDLKLAYALTIHKSQGSEWPVVIIPVHSTFSFNFDRPLLYTAISRATKMCVIVGRFRDFSHIGQKPGSITRWTDLEGKIRHHLSPDRNRLVSP